MCKKTKTPSKNNSSPCVKAKGCREENLCTLESTLTSLKALPHCVAFSPTTTASSTIKKQKRKMRNSHRRCKPHLSLPCNFYRLHTSRPRPQTCTILAHCAKSRRPLNWTSVYAVQAYLRDARLTSMRRGDASRISRLRRYFA